MLPFPKRTTTSEEIELSEDDLIVVEESTVAAAPGQTARERTPAGTRRIVPEAVEADVVGECLATIAATRDRRGSRRVPAVGAPAGLALRTLPLPFASRAPSRLPAVRPPPFVRTVSPAALPRDLREARRSSPPPAFVLRATPTPSVLPKAAATRNADSVAPVSLSEGAPRGTFIVVRARTRTRWVLGAAILAAVCAFGTTRMRGSWALPEEPAPRAAPAVLAPPATVSLPNAVVAASGTASPEPLAVLRFDDNQAVAITVTPRAPAPGPTPPAFVAPRAASPAASPPVATADSAKRRALSPEQRLAEAQLKAAMK